MITKFKSLKNHQGFRKYFKNTSWLLLERIIGLITGLLVGIWVARYLGPEKFGLFNYVQSYVGLFVAFSALGLDSIIVRELVNDENKKDVILGTSLFLKLIGTGMMIVVILLTMPFSSNDTYANLLIILIAISVIFRSFNVIEFYFQSIVASHYIVFSNILILLSSSIVKIMLIINEASLTWFVWVLFFDNFFFAFLLLFFYYKNKLSFKNWKFNFELAIKLISESWPLIFSAFIVSIYMKIDQVMIANMLDNQEVGYYAAAVKISGLWLFLPVIISTSLFPAVINSKKNNEKLYLNRLTRIYSLLIWFGLIIAVFVTFFADSVVKLTYGLDYINSTDVLIIHTWSGLFIALAAASEKWYILEKKVHHIFRRNIFGMIVNIGLNIYLIPLIGIQGAAVATLLSYVVVGYIYDLVYRDTRISFRLKTYALYPNTLFGSKI